LGGNGTSRFRPSCLVVAVARLGHDRFAVSSSSMTS
jgi:hypothetical protein